MKTIIIGFDAFDPAIFESFADKGKLPNLSKYLDHDGYARLGVSNPAQSEVSWTSIATGLNPGNHGLFDFVHRNPNDYSLHVSLLPTKSSLIGTQFIPPHSAQTIFDYAVDQGYPATTLWWPGTFPARRESPIRSIPGLGTPDILGRLGVGTYFSLDPKASGEGYKTRVKTLEQQNRRQFRGVLGGPVRKTKKGDSGEATFEFQLELIGDEEARLRIGKQDIVLRRDLWSPMLEVTFKMSLGVSIHAITQAILTEHPLGKGVYFLPLQIHPLHALWPYANPNGFGKQNWKSFGPFHTLGWPQDTTGLDEGFIGDEPFLQLCDAIISVRERVWMNQIREYREGILAIVFDSLDRIQHMFWRDSPDVIEMWYVKLDALFGRIEDQIHNHRHEDARISVVSDHGFSDFDYKVQLNRWLIDQGYLAPHESEKQGNLNDVDWLQTRAYAIGLSSIYLNLADRESQGIVREQEKFTVKKAIRDELLRWKGPDKRKVVRNVWLGEETFEGALTPYAPDIVVGFNSGYRASGLTGLGGWEADTLKINTDHWGADHCIDPELVHGVIFSNASLKEFPRPTYREFPEIALGRTITPSRTSPKSPPTYSDEDREILEERLKDLGYL